MRSSIHSSVFSPRSRSGRNQSPVMEPTWLLAHCILGKFLGVVCHCFPQPLDVPTFAAMCLCVRSDARDPSSERWNCGRERYSVVSTYNLQSIRRPCAQAPTHEHTCRHSQHGYRTKMKSVSLIDLPFQNKRPGRQAAGTAHGSLLTELSRLINYTDGRTDAFIQQVLG